MKKGSNSTDAISGLQERDKADAAVAGGVRHRKLRCYLR